MNIDRVWCMFEQSGTFKNEFIKLGIEAYDLDILNDYGQTDYQRDLFCDIDNAYEMKESIFDDINSDDLILAFYPCTRFECRVPLLFRGQATQQKTWTTEQKLSYSMKLHEELHALYMRLCKLILVCLRGGYRLIIENPYTPPHYLTMFFPIKPSFIDKDRTRRGDKFVKPTQYFFINCVPENNFVTDAITIQSRVLTIEKTHGKERSEMTSHYANRFIKEFIL